MRNQLIVAAILISSVAVAQQKGPQGPQLDTADRVAIKALEEQKASSKASYQQAQQIEQQIIQEWDAAHPGFTLNPNDFSIVALPKQESKPAPAAPKK